ncbi:MAG: dihydroorotate dehydrogenase, partial [Oscillospiraceae bacterium]
MMSIKPDLKVNLLGQTLKNPIICASGTFGYGIEYGDILDLNELGGICSKGLTLLPKYGNEG